MVKSQFMKQLSLNIPTPCHEKWENFSTTSRGGFCHSCSKEVIDFTRMTEDEIVRFLKTKPVNACGRFRATQLKNYGYEPTSAPPIYPSFAFLKAGIVSALLLVANKPLLAQARIQRTQIERFDKKNDASPIKASTADSITVKGFVLSIEDGSALPGVNVFLQGTSNGVVTDSEGRFVFDHLHEGDVLLFSFIGLTSEEFKIRKDSNPSIEIKMKMTMDIMGELSINEIYTPKQSVMRRAWWKVKNLF